MLRFYNHFYKHFNILESVDKYLCCTDISYSFLGFPSASSRQASALPSI